MFSQSLADADPRLRNRFVGLKLEYERRFPLRYLFITCTHRDAAEQEWLFARSQNGGLWLTDKDGKKSPSLHQFAPSVALDVVVSWYEQEPPQESKVGVKWDDHHAYRPLIELCRRYGLFSGGEWKRPDWAHVELPRGEIV